MPIILDTLEQLGPFKCSLEIMDVLLEVAASSSNLEQVAKLYEKCCSRFNFDSWDIVLRFYSSFFKAPNPYISVLPLIHQNLETLTTRQFFAELKKFTFSWSCFAVIFKELLFSLKFPISRLVIIAQFYAIRQESALVRDLLNGLRCGDLNIVYRTLLTLTKLKGVYITQELSCEIRRILFPHHLEFLLADTRDEFDFDIPLDYLENETDADGFNGLDFSHAVAKLPVQRIVKISPCSERLVVAQSIACLKAHSMLSSTHILELSRKTFKDLHCFLELLTIIKP